MAFKMEDALLRYLNKECTVFTVDEEFDGTLAEVGDGFILLKGHHKDTIINTSQITGVTFTD